MRETARQALVERVPQVAEGSPAEEIIRIAASRQVDLIVISTHGRTGLRHLLLGGTAERVLRQVHCPVLVVR